MSKATTIEKSQSNSPLPLYSCPCRTCVWTDSRRSCPRRPARPHRSVHGRSDMRSTAACPCGSRPPAARPHAAPASYTCLPGWPLAPPGILMCDPVSAGPGITNMLAY